MALAKCDMGKYDDAVQLVGEAKAEAETNGVESQEMYEVKIHASFVYREAGHLNEAERLAKDVLEYLRKACGPKGLETAIALRGLGIVYLKQGRYPEAESVIRESLATLEETESHRLIDLDNWRPQDWFGKDSTRLALGHAIFGQKRYAEVESLLLDGYASLARDVETKYYGRGKDDLYQAGCRIVQLYELTNQPDKARLWKTKLPPEPAPFPRWHPPIVTTDEKAGLANESQAKLTRETAPLPVPGGGHVAK
jgi:tetratricopeptide (TPR) repeat protein